MNEKGFSDLIRRYQSNTCTDQEKELIEKWFESRYESKQSDKLTPPERHEMLTDISRSLFEKINTGKNHRQVTMTPWWRVAAAAAVVLLAVSSYFLQQYMRTGTFTSIDVLQASASGNEVNKVMLADGSIIWLKGNSTLTYPEEFSGHERQVALTGEALFEVAKDPRHPFVITCGHLTATVLGTSFSIKASDDNIEVLVLTGKVSLSSSVTHQNVIVLPKEKASINPVGHLALVKTTAEDPQEVIRNTEYSMLFEAAPMSEVVTRIEKKFNVIIQVRDAHLKTCPLTADFTDQSLDRTRRC
jgi:transmembrane sensor